MMTRLFKLNRLVPWLRVEENSCALHSSQIDGLGKRLLGNCKFIGVGLVAMGERTSKHVRQTQKHISIRVYENVELSVEESDAAVYMVKVDNKDIATWCELQAVGYTSGNPIWKHLQCGLLGNVEFTSPETTLPNCPRE